MTKRNLGRWLGALAVATLALAGGEARAAATVLSAWSQQYANTNFPNNNTVSYSAPAGNNRLLVVAIIPTQNAAGAVTCSTPTYGGTALTAGPSDLSSTATWNHTAVYYLPIGNAASASAQNLVLTCSGGTSIQTWAYAAVYGGVDQTTPFSNSQSVNSIAGTTTIAASNLVIGTNQKAFYVLNLSRSTANTTARTATFVTTGANWTALPSPVEPNTPASVTTSPTTTLYIRENGTAGVTDGSTQTSSGNSWVSIAAASLNDAPTGTVTLSQGTTQPTNSSIVSGAVAALNAFQLAVSSGTAPITSVTATLTGTASATNVFVNSASACNGTTYGTATTLGATTTINTSALNLTGTTTLYLCVTAGNTAGSVTGYASGVAATGYSTSGSAAVGATVTVTLPPPNAMVVYSNNTTTPQARTYTSSTNAFGTASATVAGGNPVFVVNRASATRNERIVAYETSAGTMYVYRWNGTSWINETASGNGWNATVSVGFTAGRRFDVAYENTSGNAVVVYSRNTNGGLAYRTWNGTSWSAATSFSSSYLTGVPIWVKLSSRVTSGSNEIIAAVSDTNNDLTTFRWNGSTWTEIGTSAMSTNLQVSVTAGDLDTFALATESSSGDTFLIYAENTPNTYYRALTAGATSWGTRQTWSGGNVTITSVFAAADPDPASNRVVAGFGQSANTAVWAAVWSGTALTTPNQVGNDHTTTATTNAHTVEGAWVNTGTTRAAVVAWASNQTNNVDYAYTTNDGTNWTINGNAATTGPAVEKRWLDFAVDPKTATNAMLTFSDTNSDLWSKRVVLSGTNTFTWSDSDGGTALTATLSGQTNQPFDFSYDRYVPPAGTLTVGDNTGTEAANATVCAATGGATYADYFTLLSSAATNVTAVTAGFSASIPAGVVNLLEVTDDAGVAQGSVANPSGASAAVSGFTIAAPTTTATQYRLRVTPNPAATSWATFVTTVTAVTDSAGLAKSYLDASGATLTIDGQASPDVTGASAAATAGTVTATWTNPAAGTVPATDFGGYVVVLGNTVAITGVPAKGTSSYAVGAAVGADTVVCSGNLATCAKTALGPNQLYYLKVFTRDGCANWSAGVQVSATTPNIATTLANGTTPANVNQLAPGGATTAVDAVTFQATGQNDPTGVTSVAVTLATGTYVGISQVSVWSASSCTGTQYFTAAAPAGDVVRLSGGTAIAVTTASATAAYVCITPKSHAAMPTPPGAVYAVTALVTGFTSGNGGSGTNTTSATVNIDNASSPDVTGATATGGTGSVTANWTNPGPGVIPGTDFGSYVVVLGNTVAVTNRPAEGTGSYTTGALIGADTVVCQGNVATCTSTAALSAGQAYYMTIFTRDTVNNWSVGVAVSANALDTRTTPVALTGTVASCTLVNLAASYTGDSNNNNTVAVARGTDGVTFGTSICPATGGGTNPRACADSTVAANTNYYYRATYADVDGIVGSATKDSGLVAVGSCAPSIAVTAGTMPASASVAQGSSGTVVGRITVTPSGGTATLSSLSISSTGTMVNGSDVAAVSLFDVSSATTFVGSGNWNSATSHWDFTSLAYAIPSTTTFAVMLNVGTGATIGRTFIMNVNVPADVTVVSPQTVSNTTTIAANATAGQGVFTVSAGTPGGTTAANAPMVSIVNPLNGGVVSGTYKVQIRVFYKYNNLGINGVTAGSVQLSTDNGSTFPYTATQNSRYNTIFSDPNWATTVTGATFEYQVANPAQGAYSLRAHASIAGPVTVVSEPVQITAAVAGKGDGNLLVRDNSSQLCADCHALKTHSSEALGTKYGAWATTCRDCHAPHGTRNITLIREQITPPSVNGLQPTRNVGFVRKTGDSGKPGWNATNNKPTPDASYVNTTDNSGPCQVCHTRTADPATSNPRWRNTGNADGAHYAAPSTAACTGCHQHQKGFAGGNCTDCHATAQPITKGPLAGTRSRRPITSEFNNTWSHKRSAGGVVTKYDCGVCHMEGDATSGGTTSVHADGYVDLRDPDTGTQITDVTPPAAGAAGSYTNTTTVTKYPEFSRNLASLTIEPFAAAIMINQCLHCHDSTGAASTAARVPGGTAGQPFATTIAGAGYAGSTGNTACTTGTNGCVLNLDKHFLPTNSTYHPIEGRQNNSYTQGTRMFAPWNGITKTNGTPSYGALMTCWDCHAANGTASTTTIKATVTAHGGATTVRSNPTVSGTPSATNQVGLCIVCHQGYQAASSTNAHGTNSAFLNNPQSGMETYMNWGCNVCHGSTYWTAAVRPYRSEDVHGTNRLPPSGTYGGTGTPTAGSRWATSGTPIAFIRDLEVLNNHQPKSIGATAYSPSCDMQSTTSGVFCAAQGTNLTYTPGGVY